MSILKEKSGGMSTLLFWQGRGGRGNGNNSTGATGNGPAGRAWVHAPDLLMKGHAVYLVKFLGSTSVDQPKGIEVVKEAIRRLQFTQQYQRKSDANAKPKKVEITISVDGVAIQEPRTNNILHQFPLHRISYCADDKGAKKYFSFIAKGNTAHVNGVNGDADSNHNTSVTNGSSTETHECFVFISSKLAAEITLTIGQAFDLAYRKFLNERGSAMEAAKSSAMATEFESRLKELAALLGNAAPEKLSMWLSQHNLKSVTDWTPPANGVDINTPPNSPDNNLISVTSAYNSNHHIVDLMNNSIDISGKNPSVGTKLEGLLLNSDSDSDFDPRAAESDPPAISITPSRPRVSQQMPLPNLSQNGTSPPPLLAPPPKATKRQNLPQNNTPISMQNGDSDLFGSTPFAATNNAVNPIYSLGQNQNTNTNSATPNYNLNDFNSQTSIFPPSMPTNGTFTNGTSTMVGYDPFDTAKFSDTFSNIVNGFSNPMGNGYNNGVTNGFGHTSPFSEKQNNSAILDSSFTGFLDKRISEMKDGFSRGLVIGNEDFSVESLDPLRKN